VTSYLASRHAPAAGPALVLRLAPALILALAAPAAAQQTARATATGPAWRFVVQPQATVVYARDGSMIGEMGREIRTNVSLRTLPKYVGQAFIAVEDKRFYQHDGVDVIGMLGAIRGKVMGERMRGASTITQLLVGNMHPDVINRADRSLSRKFHEQEAAREMERHYSKDQILEAFLNQVDLGHRWFGVESAARHYFGKPAARLTLAEAASIAALPKSPPGYDPIANPAKNVERRNTILALMAEQGYISFADQRAAQAAPLVTAPNDGTSAPAQYFIDVVRAQAERAGVPVSAGGYRIHTTLDPALQRAATGALSEGAAAIEARPGYRFPTLAKHAAGASDYLQGAVVALDPATGDVRALVGGRSYAASPYDRAINAVRQPGSAFKPFVYAAAVADSMPPNEPVADTALAIPMPNGGGIYRPGNSDNQFLGLLTMREALTRSRNPVAVQLALAVGMDTVAALAHRAGISSPIALNPPSAIGASAVRPLDLVAAYTAFANLGTAVAPRFVTRIDDAAGRTVWSPATVTRPVMDPRVAFIVRDMMRDVVDRGTASSVRRWVNPTIPVAGKTGTTNDNADVWFVGVTPELVAGVWLGFDRPTPIAGVAGGSLAAPVFGRLVAQFYAGRTPAVWTPPDGLVTAELDRLSGLPADEATPADRRYTEYFLPGTEPGASRFDPLALFDWGMVGR
jgi:1A family penicillin-binding protein